jgi:hypothetical protein
MKNYFKIDILVCLFGLMMFSSEGVALHFRLTETSITENGRVHSEPDVRLKTKGYGATWISPIGLGIGYTQLATTGSEAGTTLKMNHTYLDATYTAGERFLATFGYGIGLSGDAKLDSESTKKFKASAWTLGVGFRYSAFEIYWVNRLNYPRYGLENHTLNVTSTHYQLMIGLYLP